MKGKRVYYSILLLLASIGGYAQQRHLTPAQEDTLKQERRANNYVNRKFSLTTTEIFYCNPGNYHPFWMTEVVASDRLTWLDFLKNASVEVNAGIGFEPYQGTKVKLGFDWEILSSNSKVNLYFGGEYALGFPQLTQLASVNGDWFLQLGTQYYAMPFFGVMYWPAKARQPVNMSDSAGKLAYQHPTFWRLVYFKFQAGYSVLLNKAQVTATGPFDATTVDYIRINTANTLNLKLGIGFNIPSSGDRKRRKETELMQKVQMY
jgi:hypothetical protein